MSEISVTLPDGSSRRLPAGSTPGDVAGQISPRLAKAALAAVVDDKFVDLTFPIQKDSAVPPQHRASDGGGGHEPVSRRAVRHRSGHR
jgi:threonyl-tRNA synthetase